MDHLTTLRMAQGLGVIASAVATGLGIGLSMFAMPSILLSPPDTMARQWRFLFELGKRTVPAIAIGLSSTSYAYLAYSIPHLRSTYATAAALPVLMIPYTVLLMNGTNTKLMARAEIADKRKADERSSDSSGSRGESTAQLVQTWANLNYFRTLFGISSSILGYWAVTS